MPSSKMSAINLKGTAEIIKEFLYFAINSILYQRGIYPSDKFEFVKKYGLSLLETTDPELKKYLNVNLSQLKEFLLCRNIDKLTIEITNVFTKVAVEKWDFCIECDRDFSVDHEIEADQEEIQKGIRSVIRQIIATISVLPFLDGVFTFDMLMYTDKNTALPSNKWEDAKPQYVNGSGEQLKFPTVATGIHNVGTMVSYKVD